jgi:hypothetical protein
MLVYNINNSNKGNGVKCGDVVVFVLGDEVFL